MGKVRTHISVKQETYNKAKKIQQEYAKKGITITMEDAFVLAKQTPETNHIWGWKI